MASRTIGYARTAASEGNIEEQVAALRQAGCDPIFTDEATSGSSLDRPGMNQLRAAVERGDRVLTSDMARLPRSIAEHIELTREFEEKGVTVTTLERAAVRSPSGVPIQT